MKPVIHLSDLALTLWKQGERYESADASFGQQLGLSHLGGSYNEVPPGKSGCPFHHHHATDELFFIIEGCGTYRFGPEEYAIKAGDILSAPAGCPKTAHQIINTGPAPLRYLALSSHAAADVIEYPDSGKFQSVANRPDGKAFRFVGRVDDTIDYWDGEAGA